MAIPQHAEMVRYRSISWNLGVAVPQSNFVVPVRSSRAGVNVKSAGDRACERSSTVHDVCTSRAHHNPSFKLACPQRVCVYPDMSRFATFNHPILDFDNETSYLDACTFYIFSTDHRAFTARCDAFSSN